MEVRFLSLAVFSDTSSAKDVNEWQDNQVGRMLVAFCKQANMVDEKRGTKGLDRLLGIDALATMIGATLGTSTTYSYI